MNVSWAARIAARKRRLADTLIALSRGTQAGEAERAVDAFDELIREVVEDRATPEAQTAEPVAWAAHLDHNAVSEECGLPVKPTRDTHHTIPLYTAPQEGDDER